ncbi:MULTISPECIES: transketolase family protein [unclassified Schlesneria]|uniref:transketolase family protein n=1 Tax=Schlesneria TaxID=656899 RepID=UPI002EFD7E9E
MRNAFADEITALADQDPRIVLLSGDIGNRLFNDFKDRHPDRFYNVGVAEADMIGIAAGLALQGLKPVAYTIASFAVYRAYEQIRVDLCYLKQPVVIVGVGSGLGYAANGPTHHSCEDLAVLRALPGMTVLSPADAWELRSLLGSAVNLSGPSYIRIGKKGEPTVHAEQPGLTIGTAFPLRQGSDIALLGTGTLLPIVLETADRLQQRGISAAVYSVHTVKPLDEHLLAEVFRNTKLVVTIEEHSRIGGLGGAVAEWRADQVCPGARLLRFGTPDEILHHTGEQEHARHAAGLTPERLSQDIDSAWEQSQTDSDTSNRISP